MSLLSICFDITVIYEIEFIEVGCDNDHVHFLIQGIPAMSPSEIVRIVKRYNSKGNISSPCGGENNVMGEEIFGRVDIISIQ